MNWTDYFFLFYKQKHFNLKEYTYQTYVPVKLEEDVMDSVQDSTFV